MPNRFSLRILVLLAAFSTCGANAESAPQMQGQHSDATLPELDLNPETYRTPRLGDGFRTTVFGEPVLVPKRDYSAVDAWKLGLQIEEPKPSDREFVPIAALYFWRNPNPTQLLRAEVAGVYNNILWTQKPEGWGDFEIGASFNNFTLPGSWDEVYDGRKDRAQDLFWGYFRPGFTVGYRKYLESGRPYNMWSVNWFIEPGYLYFGRSDQTADITQLPTSTFELRNRLSIRYDNLERNLLSLAHQGLAVGADVTHGYRETWRDWGTPGFREDGSKSQSYSIFGAYLVSASDLPGLRNDRYRWLNWVHAGVSENVDRFSATRIGGGPNAMGMEFGSSAMPTLPGSSIWEFYPDHYVLAETEARWEVTWFTALSARAGIGYLDAFRPDGAGSFNREEMLMPWLGGRLTTGFLGDTLLILDYTHNFGLVRGEHRGGNELMIWLSGEF